MRRLIIFLLLGSFHLLNSAQAQQQTLLYGKIANPTTTEIFIAYFEDFITETEVFIETSLVDGNEFYFALDISKLTSLQLNYNLQETTVFIEPGDKIMVEFEGSNMIATLESSGKGSEKNDYLKEFKQRFLASYGLNNSLYFTTDFFQYHINLNLFNMIESMKVEDFLSLMNSMKADAISHLENYNELVTFSDNFYKFAHNTINYRWAANHLIYHKLHLHEFSSKPVEELDDFYGFVDNMDVFSKVDISYQPDEFNFLSVYVDYLTGFECSEKGSISPDELLELSLEKLDGKGRYLFAAKMLMRGLQQKKFAFFDEGFDQFRNKNPHMELTEIVRLAHEKVSGLATGGLAPDFTLTSVDGNELQLSNYQGQIVYLSFWASWCKPCMENFRTTKDIKKELEKQGVLFLNVSIDDNESNWKQAIEKNNIDGKHVIINPEEKNQLNKEYNISTLPAYFIIDKEGKFVNIGTELEAIKKDLIELAVE